MKQSPSNSFNKLPRAKGSFNGAGPSAFNKMHTCKMEISHPRLQQQLSSLSSSKRVLKPFSFSVCSCQWIHFHLQKRRGCQSVGLCPAPTGATMNWETQAASDPFSLEKGHTESHLLVLNLHTFSNFLSPCPNGNQIMVHGRWVHFHIDLLSVSVYQAAWTPSRMLLLVAAPRESGSVWKRTRPQKDEIHFRHGSSLDAMNQTLGYPVLFDSMQHGW